MMYGDREASIGSNVACRELVSIVDSKMKVHQMVSRRIVWWVYDLARLSGLMAC